MNAQKPLQRHIGFVGEFNSGKTTALNMLLPAQFRLPESPLPASTTPLTVTYGHQATLVGVRGNAAVTLSRVGLAAFLACSPAAFDRLSLTLPCKVLRTCALTDVHAIDGPASIERAQEILRQCTDVVWLTLGTQAWKRSESIAWRSLFESAEHARKMLFVSHSDLLTPDERRSARLRLSALIPTAFDELHFVGRNCDEMDGMVGPGQVPKLFGLPELVRTTSARALTKRRSGLGGIPASVLPPKSKALAQASRRKRVTSDTKETPPRRRPAKSPTIPPPPKLPAHTISAVAAKEALAEIQDGVSGFVAAALVDRRSGRPLAALATEGFSIKVAAKANADVVGVALKAIDSLKQGGAVEDIVFTVADQYHLVRPHAEEPSVFLYLAVDRTAANLALARYALENAEAGLRS